MLGLASFPLFPVEVVSISSSVAVTVHCGCVMLLDVIGCYWSLWRLGHSSCQIAPCVLLPDWKGQAGIRACGRRLAGVGRWFGVLLQKHLILVHKLEAVEHFHENPFGC